MDNNDTKLLQLLHKDSKLSVQELAKETGLPPTTVHNRIKRMEKDGIIKSYTADINWKKAGKPVMAYVLVSFEYILPTGGRVQQEDSAKEIKGMQGVEEVSVGVTVSVPTREKVANLPARAGVEAVKVTVVGRPGDKVTGLGDMVMPAGIFTGVTLTVPL